LNSLVEEVDSLWTRKSERTTSSRTIHRDRWAHLDHLSLY
jgi:hypothetical protein